MTKEEEGGGAPFFFHPSLTLSQLPRSLCRCVWSSLFLPLVHSVRASVFSVTSGVLCCVHSAFLLPLPGISLKQALRGVADLTEGG